MNYATRDAAAFSTKMNPIPFQALHFFEFGRVALILPPLMFSSVYLGPRVTLILHFLRTRHARKFLNLLTSSLHTRDAIYN